MVKGYLALDCTGETYSCGLLSSKGRFTEVVGLNPRRALLEMPGHIAHLLRVGGISSRDVEAVGVPRGPGSFTGVRLGIALAKTVALAAECDVFSIDTLELLARQTAESYKHAEGVIAVASDARRGELYCGVFSRSGEARLPTAVRTPQEFGPALSGEDGLLALVGGGFEAYPDLIPVGFRGAVESSREAAALSMNTLCALTKEAAQSGRLQARGLVQPEYHRRADIQVSG